VTGARLSLSNVSQPTRQLYCGGHQHAGSATSVVASLTVVRRELRSGCGRLGRLVAATATSVTSRHNSARSRVGLPPMPQPWSHRLQPGWHEQVHSDSDSPVLNPAELTVECWVMWNNLDTPAPASIPASNTSSSSRTRARVTSKATSSAKTAPGTTSFSGSYLRSGELVRIDSTSPVTTNVWYHLAGVRGSNYIQIYFNGRLEAQTNVDFRKTTAIGRSTSAPREVLLRSQAERVIDEVASTTGRCRVTKSPPFMPWAAAASARAPTHSHRRPTPEPGGRARQQRLLRRHRDWRRPHALSMAVQR